VNNIEQRRQTAILWYSQGRSAPEIARELGVSPATIYNDLKGCPKRNVTTSQRAASLDAKAPKLDFEEYLECILTEAKRSLEDLKSDSDLRPEVRVKQIQSLIDSISKATQTIKKLDPQLNLEMVIGETLRIVGEVLSHSAPELAEQFIAQTHLVEQRILLAKHRWQV